VGSHALDEELTRQIEILAPDQKRQVLDFALTLGPKRPKGTPGWRLAGFKAWISPEDLDVMAAEIEAACEQVRSDEWSSMTMLHRQIAIPPESAARRQSSSRGAQ